MKNQKNIKNEADEKVKLYVEKINTLISTAEKDDIVISAVLKGNQFFTTPIIGIRAKTAEERLAKIESENKKSKGKK